MKNPSPLDVINFTDAAARGYGRDVEKFLKEYGSAIINKTDPGDQTALMRAVCGERSMIVDILLKAGADTEYKNGYGSTALIYAVELKNKNIVESLLQNGAVFDPNTQYGKLVLTIANFHGNPEITALLEEWHEKRKQQWLNDTDFSKGLQRDMPATRPLKASPRKGMKP